MPIKKAIGAPPEVGTATGGVLKIAETAPLPNPTMIAEFRGES